MTSIFLAYLYGAANGALLYYYLAYQHINRAKDTCRHYERVVQAITLQHGEDKGEYLQSKRKYEQAEQELKNIAINNWNKPFKSLHRHCYERHQEHRSILTFSDVSNWFTSFFK